MPSSRDAILAANRAATRELKAKTVAAGKRQTPSAYVRDYKEFATPDALPAFFVRGSRSLTNTRPRLSKRVRDELDDELGRSTIDLVDVVQRLAGGTKSAFPYKTGAAVRSLKGGFVSQRNRPEGSIGSITTNLPYVKKLERGAYYHTGRFANFPFRVKAGHYIRRAYNRYARSLFDRRVEEALHRAFERAARRREKIDIQIRGGT